MTIRPTTPTDAPALARIADATELFPGEMLADMLGAEDGAVWLTADHEGAPAGFLYAVPEQLAEGAWNMLAIAVYPDRHGKGIGTALNDELVRQLKGQGARILLADTSGTEAFEATRAFYRARGYSEEATIRDFWAEGDSKVTFRLAL